MMNQSKSILSRVASLAAVAVILLLSSCGSKDEPDDPVNPGGVSRTVLVYMAANNSLGSEKVTDSATGITRSLDGWDIYEMEQAVTDKNSLNGGRLLVFQAPYRGTQRLIEITPKGSKELKTYSSTQSSVSAERMSEVLSDVKFIAKADDYGLVFWSHGSGWIEENSSRAAARPRSWGEDNSNKMKITTLANVIRNSGMNPSFIYFDACFMGCVEIIYQLRDLTKEIVASGTELQIFGMNYTRNIPVFFAKDRTLETAARNTFDSYQKKDQVGVNYSDCTISYYRTEAMEEFAKATRAIMETGATAPDDYVAIRYGSRSFMVYDMPDYIRSMNAPAELIDAWDKAYAKLVPYSAHTAKYGNIDTSRYGGMGTYPVESISDAHERGYSNYEWWTDVVSHNPSIK